MSRAAAIKHGYTTGARGLASRSVTGLTRTRITPNALTATGVLLCARRLGARPLRGPQRGPLLLARARSCSSSARSLDILDGALARAGGKTTPFGAFIDSTTDRVSEGFMLTAIAYVLATDDHPVFVAVAVAAVAGSFLVSYTRAQAEALGLRGDVGIGSRAERVVVITAGLVLAPWGVLPWALVLLAVHRVGHRRPARPARPQATDGGNNTMSDDRTATRSRRGSRRRCASRSSASATARTRSCRA